MLQESTHLFISWLNVLFISPAASVKEDATAPLVRNVPLLLAVDCILLCSFIQIGIEAAISLGFYSQQLFTPLGSRRQVSRPPPEAGAIAHLFHTNLYYLGLLVTWQL